MGVEIAFQTAIYTRLNDQIVGGGKPCQGVYDVGPQEADASGTPFVNIGETIWTLDDTDTSLNFQGLLRVHTWSRSGSMLETKTIQGQMYDALHDYALTVTGWNCYSLLRETSTITRGTDNVFHGICEYRALLQESA